ncbi:NAD+ synthase (glutamine-hydrolysing) [Catalinimonas alkaloidigena]|uniref:Glutamine-dependent NAD(+) synthetase n=1 Tax=Catalinimonas alkaloidigena TaxID=1075417 RepID=A0A1G8WEQ8_9BACT|nr:nitrilase-related carbon-nitrogen hydrolase [Catalinimonas alkaloidigena]SDJ76721.1 NAD+ synthase (glutamine-hydrolysing) [Catalinimonas alkaloidigena]
MRKRIVAGAALNQIPIDWEGNRNRILEALQQARAAQVDLLCLPELCITGYGCEDLFLSEWVPARAVEALLELVPHCTDLTVAIGLPVRFEGKTYDCAALVHNGVLLGIQAKQFMANEGVHYEPRWFTPWPTAEESTIEIEGQTYPFGDIIFEVEGVRIGFEICEDAWHGPKRPGVSHCRRGGVDLILNPSASHFAFAKTLIRHDLVLDGAQRFRCAYVYANLIGNEAGKMIYDGEILIAQHGRLLKRNALLSFRDVNLVTTELDFDADPEQPLPSLPPYAVSKEEEFAAAVPLALFDYMRKSRSRGFVLSLSGGADSSACAVLVAEMVRRGCNELGVEAFAQKAGCLTEEEMAALLGKAPEVQLLYLTQCLLRCAYQGTVNSSQATLASAQNLAESVGAAFYEWKIDDEVAGYTRKIERALGRPLTWERDDITLQNIQARARSPIIWMLTNATGALLMATSNRSEGDVGYATMDGDTSGSISPIAGVDKHFISRWLRWAEERLGYTGLHDVNSLTPTAELRPLENSQTDEGDLMPYRVLYEIERLAIRDRQSPIHVYRKLVEAELEPPALLRSHVIKFFRLWSRNQWKRERLAPSFHVDDFSVDPRSWCRFPILSSGFTEELKALELEEVPELITVAGRRAESRT